MLAEYSLLLQIMVFVFFIIGFYARHELIWVFALLLSGIMAASSVSIEYAHYIFNATTTGYDWTVTIYSYPFLTWMNIAIAVIILLFLIFDIWENYILKISKKTDAGMDKEETMR